LAIKII